jgi:glycosyltransferase involved in cell wall biosynthesis
LTHSGNGWFPANHFDIMTTAVAEHSESIDTSRGSTLRVAYILHRFPYLTETFIMREMYCLHRKHVELHIFSLLPPIHEIVHNEAKYLLARARYSPFMSLEVLAAQLYFLRRSPLRYIRSLAKTIRQTWHEPKTLARALALFPKSVLFARRMQELDIQHAHAHFVWLEGIAAGIAAELIGITFTIHPHAFGLFSRNRSDVRFALENATKVVTVSSYHRNFIDKLCPRIHSKDIAIVHYGVNTQLFRPDPHRAANAPLRILSVGRLVEKKGYEYLIEACGLLRNRGVEFECNIVGGGRQRKVEFQSRIDELGLQRHINLLGALSQDDILELYQTSDVFALACTSASNGDQDGMPNVLIEAMSCALPVVTTPIAGIPDLVVNDENGRLVDARDATALADALEELINQSQLRRRLGDQARRTVIRDYQIEQNAEALAHIFKTVAASNEQAKVEPVVAKAGTTDLVDTVSEVG